MGDVLVMAVVGAGLVFAALAIVWVAIAVLVRMTARPSALSFETAPQAGVAAGRTEPHGEPEARAVPDERTARACAAAIAVAVAVARWEADVAAAGSSQVSPWQAAMRAQRLQQKRPRGR